MRETHWMRAALIGALVALTAVLVYNCESNSGNDGSVVALLRANPLPGAIFTTLPDGTAVNHNIYEAKEDVYLDGGPGPRAPAGAAGLPEGDYYFQVTDPSGQELLSTDHISCRRFHVNEAGVIDHVYSGTTYRWHAGSWVAEACVHSEGIDADHGDLGAITVQLMPYADTPNRGGVYKVWVTRVEDYLGDPGLVPEQRHDSVAGEDYQPGSFHGFAPSTSKTDNYKVRRRGPPYVPPVVEVRKFHDRNLDGEQQAGEETIEGWRVGVSDPLGTTNNVYTTAEVNADEGVWLMVEDTPPLTLQTVAILDGAVQSIYPTADPVVSVVIEGDSEERHVVIYGNVGVGGVDACKVYDRDGDGQVDDGEPPVPGWTFELSGTDVSGDAIGPLLQTTDASGCTRFSDLLPGTYTVTETIPAGGAWVASGATSQELNIESSLDGETLVGTSGEAYFTNYCTATVAFGTKGYWHNRNGLDELADEDIDYANTLTPYVSASSYFEGGDEPFDGLFTDGTLVPAAHGITGELLASEGTPRAEVSAFLIDANAGGDPREQLAQQLLAFVFNTRNRLDDPAAAIQLPGGTWVSASSLIDQAIDVWLSGTAAEQTAMQTLLEGFNSSDAVSTVRYTPCAIE